MYNRKYKPMNLNEGGNSADKLAEERGNVENVAAFSTPYEGKEFAFNPSDAPPDQDEFNAGDLSPGALVHSRDTYLYVVGGPELDKSLKRGWYKSVSAAGTPTDIGEGEAQEPVVQEQQGGFDNTFSLTDSQLENANSNGSSQLNKGGLLSR